MDYDLVIAGGEIVSTSGRMRADLGIRGERIAAVGQGLSGRERIDAAGKLVLPGAIDVHTHFQLPFCGTVSADDFANGSKAAALGGVTTFIDFAIQARPQPVTAAVEARRAEADPKVCVDYGLHAALTEWNAARASEVRELIRTGVPTFKMFMIYRSQGWQANDADLYAALREVGRHGGMVGVHAENDDLITLLQREAEEQGLTGAYAHALTRPAVTEYEAVARAINLAAAAEGRLYIVHLSTGAGLERVEDGILRGVDVHAETCPQYLLLDDELFKRADGHHFATCPPIRKPADSARLWEGLTGGALEIVATDTCTFDSRQKAMWGGDYRKIPMGLPGIELLLPLMYTAGVGQGRLTLEHMVELLCENPARLFGMWPRKGVLQAGSDADVVLFDPALRVTVDHRQLATNCDYSPYDGFEAEGWPVTTLVRGRPVVRDRRFVGVPGQGRFIAREPVAEAAG